MRLSAPAGLEPIASDEFKSAQAEVSFTNIRVLAENLLGADGEGLKIAHTRLAVARSHHSMRLVGLAERALKIARARSAERPAFGSKPSQIGTFRNQIAECRLMFDRGAG